MAVHMKAAALSIPASTRPCGINRAVELSGSRL